MLLKHCEAVLKNGWANQVLRKLVKLHSFQNVNRCYTNDFRHFLIARRCLFCRGNDRMSATISWCK
ncbi:hypothetical protein DW084_16930 [Enterococcus casseliflavus]|uniref:Uncharacterized protein n=1 Tax=Enterococcus casseliflavus TaxID=37734 RepID=A0A415EMU9_ENTCA|nr:hypothetical protein DW084_16930 [Enterococcus casseliflavus]